MVKLNRRVLKVTWPGIVIKITINYWLEIRTEATNPWLQLRGHRIWLTRVRSLHRSGLSASRVPSATWLEPLWTGNDSWTFWRKGTVSTNATFSNFRQKSEMPRVSTLLPPTNFFIKIWSVSSYGTELEWQNGAVVNRVKSTRISTK